MKTSVIMHFYNEELLIGPWIDHHKSMFDCGILINHSSTDASVEIARSKLPHGWSVVDTRLNDFNAIRNDEEVMEIEKTLTDSWKVALNTTEFMFHPDLRGCLDFLEKSHPETTAFGSRAACLVDYKENLPIESPIWKNRTYGFLYEAGKPAFHRYRWIHKAEHGHYTPGRHDTHLPKRAFGDFLHLHLMFSPWPECIERKLQIQDRVPISDKQQGFGIQHITTKERLEITRSEVLKHCQDLMQFPEYKQAYEGFST